MGTFRCGIIAVLIAGCISFAQDPNVPAPVGTNATVVAAPIDPLTGLPVQPADPNALAPVETIVPVVTDAPPAAPKKPAVKKAPALPSARGSLARIDKVAMTITVDAKGKEQVFRITSKSRIFADGKPAIFGDLREGENLVVEYQTAKDKTKEALFVSAGVAAVKAAPKKAAAKPTKKPKTPQPEEAAPAVTPTAPVDNAVPAPAPEADPNLPAPGPNPNP